MHMRGRERRAPHASACPRPMQPALTAGRCCSRLASSMSASGSCSAVYAPRSLVRGKLTTDCRGAMEAEKAEPYLLVQVHVDVLGSW